MLERGMYVGTRVCISIFNMIEMISIENQCHPNQNSRTRMNILELLVDCIGFICGRTELIESQRLLCVTYRHMGSALLPSIWSSVAPENATVHCTGTV